MFLGRHVLGLDGGSRMERARGGAAAAGGGTSAAGLGVEGFLDEAADCFGATRQVGLLANNLFGYFSQALEAHLVLGVLSALFSVNLR